MNTRRQMLRSLALAAGSVVAGSTVARAATFRQYYGPRWVFHPARSYYYMYYYYLPTPQATAYAYHYCIYDPARPRYIYYYNPVNQVYWGRFEVGSTGDQQYSLLAAGDRQKDLEAIPERAFPAPARMPEVPGADDGVQMDPPPVGNLPTQADRP